MSVAMGVSAALSLCSLGFVRFARTDINGDLGHNGWRVADRPRLRMASLSFRDTLIGLQ